MSLLRVESLSIRFGGHLALDGVDLAVHEGETVGLIGPNGAGKTTVFNCISGFLRPDAGRIVFRGSEITRLPPQRRARLGLGRTFQLVEGFSSLTVMENVVLGAEGVAASAVIGSMLRTPGERRRQARSYAKADAVLRVVGIEEHADTRLGNLPLGVLRRVEIARALASSPVLLCLDEPFSGMDEVESLQFAELIPRICDLFGVSILVVDHDIRVVKAISHQLYVLDFGRIVAAGEPAVVSRNPTVVAAYLGEEVQTNGAGPGAAIR